MKSSLVRGSRQMRHIGCEPLLLRLRPRAPLPSCEPLLSKRFMPPGPLALALPPSSPAEAASPDDLLPRPRSWPRLATRSPRLSPLAALRSAESAADGAAAAAGGSGAAVISDDGCALLAAATAAPPARNRQQDELDWKALR